MTRQCQGHVLAQVGSGIWAKRISAGLGLRLEFDGRFYRSQPAGVV